MHAHAMHGLEIWLSSSACLAHGFHFQEEGGGKPHEVLLMKQSSHPGWAEWLSSFQMRNSDLTSDHPTSNQLLSS